MPAVHETAYPRIKSNLSEREAAEAHTPTRDELAFVDNEARGHTKICLLVTLKVFQRLGYFKPLSDVPKVIIRVIARAAGYQIDDQAVAEYDRSRTRERHLVLIREYLAIRPYGKEARKAIAQAVAEAARTKDVPADLINVAIEELLRQQFELPAFSTLNRISRRVRALVYRSFFRQITNGLSAEDKEAIDALFRTSPQRLRSIWNELKEDPEQATLTTLREHVKYLAGLQQLQVGANSLVGIPDVKVKQFAVEAKSLHAGQMAELQPTKRYALACSFLAVQVARAHDDMAELFIKRMAAINKKGQEALAEYQKTHLQRTDQLVATLHEILEVHRGKGSKSKRLQTIDGILEPKSDKLWEDCVAHMTYANNNHCPFLWNFYKTHRPTLFGIIKTVQLRSTSQETALETALKFIAQHEDSRADWLPTYHEEGRGKKKTKTPLLDLSWVSDKWWGLIAETKRGFHPERIDRRQFEVCLFAQVALELKAGDLYIEGADKYSDYREQLVPLEEYQAKLPAFCEMLELPADPAAIVRKFKSALEEQIRATDKSFPQNEAVRVKDGEPIITPIKRKQPSPSFKRLRKELDDRIQPVNVLDILTDTTNLLSWHQVFGPLSGHDAKIPDAQARYLAMVFGYGSNLGPVETAKHFRGGFTSDQLSDLNRRHSSVDRIQKAITLMVNAYNQFQLPKYWGTGKRASVDGTKWDLYEQNLLSENHVRYGGYGGIGYYHVSDTYIDSAEKPHCRVNARVMEGELDPISPISVLLSTPW